MEVEEERGVEIEEVEQECNDEEEVEDEGNHVIEEIELHGHLHLQPLLHCSILLQIPQFQFPLHL